MGGPLRLGCSGKKKDRGAKPMVLIRQGTATRNSTEQIYTLCPLIDGGYHRRPCPIQNLPGMVIPLISTLGLWGVKFWRKLHFVWVCLREPCMRHNRYRYYGGTKKRYVHIYIYIYTCFVLYLQTCSTWIYYRSIRSETKLSWSR